MTSEGELLVEEGFLDRRYPKKEDESYLNKMEHFIDNVGLDIVTIKADDDAGLVNLIKIAEQRTCFIMALVDGLFWNSKDPVSFQDFITGIFRKEEGIKELIQIKKKKSFYLLLPMVGIS